MSRRYTYPVFFIVDISSVGCLGGFSRKDESKNSYMCHGSLHFIALDIQLITQALVFRAR